jgi:hypothetical protein
MSLETSWTPERVDHLKELAGQKLSARQIGIELGVSRNSVIGKMRRMGIPLLNPPSVRGLSRTRPIRNGGAVIAGLKARQRQERTIRSKIGDNRIKAAMLARAVALGELSGYEAIGLAPEPIGAPAVALADLRPEHCRWPIDFQDGSVAYRRFCGCKRMHDLTPYCSMHHKVAYIGLPTKRRD